MRYDALLVLLLKCQQSVNQDLTPTKGRKYYAILSRACNLLSNCFVKKLLSGVCAYIGLARPYQYFGWYGPGHTASAALAND